MRLLLISVIFLNFVGCSALKIYDAPVKKLPLHLNDPAEIDLSPVVFKVITTENAETTIGGLGETEAMICLDDAGYNALTTNILKIRNYIILHKKLLQHYKDYYEPEEK